ncbi:hypothetical protein TorRG33x02_243620 [Trema orientale]|uniref:Uncharacterized protein n=1 Tax=Trema orientale TaxID=63057 RepID=A0A2P5DS97_TREOI|nr:hypothetical protein TorRG33x02_243620 [Trema orientale]
MQVLSDVGILQSASSQEGRSPESPACNHGDLRLHHAPLFLPFVLEFEDHSRGRAPSSSFLPVVQDFYGLAAGENGAVARVDEVHQPCLGRALLPAVFAAETAPAAVMIGRCVSRDVVNRIPQFQAAFSKNGVVESFFYKIRLHLHSFADDIQGFAVHFAAEEFQIAAVAPLVGHVLGSAYGSGPVDGRAAAHGGACEQKNLHVIRGHQAVGKVHLFHGWAFEEREVLPGVVMSFLKDQHFVTGHGKYAGHQASSGARTDHHRVALYG